MIKYKANYYWRPEVEKVEVERETDFSVWVKGCPEAKQTRYHVFFDTFAEAKAFLIDVFEKKAQDVRFQLEQANGLLGSARGLKDV
jgi:hypothetical protein